MNNVNVLIVSGTDLQPHYLEQIRAVDPRFSIKIGLKQLIKELREKDGKVEDIKIYIKALWEDSKNADHILGGAVESTIAKIDRIGFFLLKVSKNPKGQTPVWIWAIVEKLWEKLGKWVEHRQNCEKDDPDFYSRGHGVYFKELEEYRKKHNL